MRRLELGPKGPTDAAEGCSSLQVLEKATRRVAIFLVRINKVVIEEAEIGGIWSLTDGAWDQT